MNRDSTLEKKNVKNLEQHKKTRHQKCIENIEKYMFEYM